MMGLPAELSRMDGAFMASDSEASLLFEIDPICEAFEDALRSGDQPRIEEYLASCGTNARELLLYHLLTLEVDYRRASRENPEAVEYLTRFGGEPSVIQSVFHEAHPASKTYPKWLEADECGKSPK